MLPLRHQARWRIAGIVILLVVMAATIIPTSWIWPVFSPSTFLLSDKLLHMLTFLFLSVWFTGQYRPSAYWRLVVGLIAFGVLIELGQAMLSYRAAEATDLVADVVGISVGLAAAFAGLGGWSLRFEQWLSRGQVGID